MKTVMVVTDQNNEIICVTVNPDLAAMVGTIIEKRWAGKKVHVKCFEENKCLIDDGEGSEVYTMTNHEVIDSWGR